MVGAPTAPARGLELDARADTVPPQMIDDNRRPDQGRRKRIGLVLLTAGPSGQHQTPEETGRLEGEHPDGQRSGLAEVAAADAA
ncbi:MAG: hypothetical protein QOJ19_3234, partial [Acidimicrobiia bacterium]|nr:hypothetical protein [Acidimicrobiia bacterium]